MSDPLLNQWGLGLSTMVSDPARDAEDEASRSDRARSAILDNVERLRGHDLACWCRPGAPCHADVLLEIANRPRCEEVAP